MSDYKTMPWSIKGVPESVRTIAKEQAAAAGMTMGAWLAQVISTAGGVASIPAIVTTPPVAQASVSTRAAENNNTAIAAKPAEETSNAELGQLVLKVAKRLAVLENDTAQFGSAFQDQLSDLRKRMLVLENNIAIPASVNVAFSQG